MADPMRSQVEALAQLLYEDLNPGSVPWRDRTRTVREAWIQEAARRLRETQSAPV